MEADDTLLGAEVDGHVLVERLGDGGMGVVYRARPADGSPDIAIKVLHPQLTAEPEVFERFEREARIGMQIDHAKIVRTLDVGTIDHQGIKSRYLSMDLVEGQTLRRLLDELGRVPEALCLHIATEIAEGLAAIHAAGIVHRDLKPENVLITPADEIKLMDLGVARLMDEAVRLSRTGQFVGSVLYAAPEQLEARARVGAPLDLWALGVLLYELSTGENPFHADTLHGVIQRILGHQPPPPSRQATDLSPFFDRVLRSLLEKSAAERFPSAPALLEVLRDGLRSPWWKTRTDAEAVLELAERTRLKVSRLTACHGREAELAALRERFDRIAANGAQGMLIEGEAGVGKTRLADAFVATLATDDPAPLVLVGAPAPGGAATAHGAIAEALRGGLPEHGFDEALASHLGEARGMAPAFGALLRNEPPPDGASALTPGALHSLFAQVLRNLGRTQPVIVVVDDMHRAPVGTRALVAGLLTALADAPVFLLMLGRPGIPSEWTTELLETGRLGHLLLGRLDETAVRAILDELFAGDLGVEDLAAPIIDRTDGNARFVFAALERLGEQGVIERSPHGPWHVTRGLRSSTEISLPDSARDALAARLDQLSDDERELLQAAAAIGPRFDPDVVAQVLEEKRLVVLRQLSRLERRGRIVHADGRMFGFDHPQLGEALYESMPELEREATHAAIASVLLARLAAEPAPELTAGSELGVAVCRHLIAGGRGPEALPMLLKALRFLEASYRREEALELLDASLDAPGLLAGDDRSWYLFERAHLLGTMGRVHDAIASLRESMEAAPENQEARARALRSLAWNSYTVRNLDEARLQAEEARQLSIEGSFVSTLGAAERLLGLIASREGRFRAAQRRLRVAADIGRQINDDDLLMNALLNLGTAVALQDASSEAAAHFEAALEIARRAGHRQVEQAALGNLAYLNYLHGEFEASVRNNEEAIAIAKEIGHRGGQATGHGNLGWILAEMGQYNDAERHARRQIALAEETNQLDTLLSGLERVAMIRMRLGDVLQAAELIRRRERAATAQPPHAVATADLAGLLARTEGRYEDALGHLEQAVIICRENDLRPQLGRSLVECAAVLIWLGRESELDPLLEEAQEVGTAIKNPRVIVLAACHGTHCGRRTQEEALRLYAEYEKRLGADDRIEALWSVWRSARDPQILARAWDALARLDADITDAPEALPTVPRDLEIARAYLDRPSG